jgi:SGNH hydrolase-like domain, acetyltransferase AlgX
MVATGVFLSCLTVLAGMPGGQPPTKRAASSDAATLSAERNRLASIQASLRRLENELETHGEGSWEQWYARLAPYRTTLRQRVEASKIASGLSPLFEAKGEIPLFEDSDDVSYLWEDVTLDSWLERRTSLATITRSVQWLKTQGVDVIFVPVPKMSEVYPDRMVPDVPVDRLVAPQVRRLLLAFLQAGVEVVDILPDLLAASSTGGDPLYMSDDPHWAPRGQAIGAKAIAERLRRYPFVKAAMAKPALFQEKPVSTHATVGTWRPSLDPGISKALDDFTWHGIQILDRAGQPFKPADSSPVVIIGDSYCSSMNVMIAPGTAIDAELSMLLNLPVTNLGVGGATVEVIKDFARDPELLKGRKVVVWILRNAGLGKTTGWDLAPLPDRTPRTPR